MRKHNQEHSHHSNHSAGHSSNHSRDSDRGHNRQDHGNRSARNENSNADKFYDEHLSVADLKLDDPDTHFFVGELKVFPKKRRVGYVKCPGLPFDIMIEDEKRRNRAIFGDLVVVSVYPEEKWVEVERDESEFKEAVGSEVDEEKVIVDLLWKPKHDVLSDHKAGKAETDKEKEASGLNEYASNIVKVATARKLQPTGKIVAILERRHSSSIVGAMQSAGVSEISADDTKFFFQPMDQRYPSLYVSRVDLPDIYHEDPLKMTNQILIANIDPIWPVNSKFPHGIDIRTVGERGEISAETDALLFENGIEQPIFTLEMMESVSEILGVPGIDGETKTVDWKIPQDVIDSRRDMRSYRIFTIDPTTAKDLDDAVHVEELEDGTFSVGVHIADVSYYLREGTLLDRVAAERSTSVYLVQKVLPMLPPILSENLCSLNPNVDRLAFSCIWKMNADGSLVDEEPWYGRTVIRSCSKLDYVTAQRMIDGIIPSTPSDDPQNSDSHIDALGPEVWDPKRRPIEHKGWECAKDVLMLHKIAMNRRRKRLEKGSLVVQQSKLSFVLDETGNPVSVTQYPIRESNSLIEEYMLLANYLVAEKLIRSVGGAAVLRRHGAPRLKDMKPLRDFAERMNLDMNFEDLVSLRDSMKAVMQVASEELKMCLSALLLQPLKRANCFIAFQFGSEEWKHFGLNIPYYTHFTSPIRRYVDVMVHRMLDVSLNLTPEKYEEVNTTAKLDEAAAKIQHYNDMKDASKEAQTRSDRVFMSVFLANRPEYVEGVVFGIGAKSFSIVDSKYGMNERIFVDDMKGVVSHFDDQRGVLSLVRDLEIVEEEPSQGNSSNVVKKVFDSIELRIGSRVSLLLSSKNKTPIDVRFEVINVLQ